MIFCAIVEAAIAFVIIAVVTGFHPDMDIAISALGHLAGFGTRVAAVSIPVITGFDAVVHKAITAASKLTRAQAPIGLEGIAIIAGFAGVFVVNAIATTVGLTGHLLTVDADGARL